MRRRLRDCIHNSLPNRLLEQQHIRKWRLKVKRHSNKSKKSFYKTRYWELMHRHQIGLEADSRNSMKRQIERAYRRSDNVAVIHRSIGMFHNCSDSYNKFTIVDAKTNKHIITVDAMTNEELLVTLSVVGYDSFVWSPYMSCIIE